MLGWVEACHKGANVVLGSGCMHVSKEKEVGRPLWWTRRNKGHGVIIMTHGSVTMRQLGVAWWCRLARPNKQRLSSCRCSHNTDGKKPLQHPRRSHGAGQLHACMMRMAGAAPMRCAHRRALPPAVRALPCQSCLGVQRVRACSRSPAACQRPHRRPPALLLRVTRTARTRCAAFTQATAAPHAAGTPRRTPMPPMPPRCV